jgi:hypothetical protein
VLADVPKIFKPTNGVSQEPRPTHLNVIVSVGGHSMLPKNYIKIRGQMISAPTELNCNSCFALLYTRKARKQQKFALKYNVLFN